jgi:hypothetical protein
VTSYPWLCEPEPEPDTDTDMVLLADRELNCDACGSDLTDDEIQSCEIGDRIRRDGERRNACDDCWLAARGLLEVSS